MLGLSPKSAFGIGLMAGTGPRPHPVGLGGGLQLGLQNALQQESLLANNAYVNLQKQMMQQSIEETERKRKEEETQRAAASKMYPPGHPLHEIASAYPSVAAAHAFRKPGAFEQKIATTEQALGRKLTEAEILKMTSSAPTVSTTVHNAPAGFRMKPDGSYEAVPGGPQDPGRVGPAEMAKRRDSARALDAAIDSTTELINMITKHGPESFGSNADKMRAARGDALAGVAALRNLGVIQPGEAMLLEQQFLDPTTMSAQWRALTEGNRGVSDPYTRLLNKMTEARRRLGVVGDEEPTAPDVPKTPEMPTQNARGQYVVKNEEDYAKVPAGAKYIDPNGIARTKRRQ